MKRFCFILLIFANYFQLFCQDKIEIENLGKKVNSVYDDLFPIIAPDGKTLYFVRDSDPLNTFGAKGSQDIWFSVLDSTNNWSIAQRLGFPFNQVQYNCVFSVSPDGNTLLIEGSYEKGVYDGIGCSVSHRTINGWSLPQKLNIKNYAKLNKGIYNGAYLTTSGKELLLFFSKDKESINNDIYVSFLQKDSSWSEPKNLGFIINSAANETSPFLAADGVSLFYSSNKGGGAGKGDIYMSKRLDNTWQKWSKPKNLGKPINTNEWEAYYSFDASSNYAYMVSYKKTIGKADIVRVKTIKENKPDPVVIIYGTVYNTKTKKTISPSSSTINYEYLKDAKNIGTANSNPKDGTYKIVLPYGSFFSFSAEAKGYYSISDNIDLTKIGDFKEIKRDLYLTPIEIGEIIRLNNIFFDFDKAILRPESFPELEKVLKLLNSYPKMIIELNGHTDSYGDDDYNINLSQNRADAVKNYLVSKGISLERIKTIGFGESKPIATNETEEGRQLNRRIEFVIISY